MKEYVFDKELKEAVIIKRNSQFTMNVLIDGGKKNAIVPPQQGSGMWMYQVCAALFPRVTIQRES